MTMNELGGGGGGGGGGEGERKRVCEGREVERSEEVLCYCKACSTSRIQPFLLLFCPVLPPVKDKEIFTYRESGMSVDLSPCCGLRQITLGRRPGCPWYP